MLYELLTGSAPLDKKRLKQAAFAEILRVIREEEPQKPSTRLSGSKDSLPSVSAQRHMEPAKLAKLVGGELDWIVMKALEKDRSRRYESANGFAMDVQRYLADEPVQACPPSAGYRLRKLVRRNKGPVLAAAVVLLTLVGGIMGTSWGAIRAEQARKRETERADAEGLAKQQALEAQARAEARGAEMKAVLDFVESKIFAVARPKDQAGGQGYDVKLADAVKAAMPFVDKSFTAQPVVEGRLRTTMGTSFLYLGDAKAAIEQYEAARQLYTKYLGSDNPDTLGSMNNLAVSYFHAGSNQKALELHEETLRLRKAKLGPDHPDTLESMVNLATSYAAAGRTKEALELRKETLQLHKAKLGPDAPETLMSMANLAYSYRDAGRTREALELGQETLQLRIAKLGPNHPDTLASMHNLADFYSADGRAQRVKTELGNSLEQTFLAWTYGLMGQTEQAGLDYAAAVVAYAKSVKIFEELDQAGALKDWFFRQRLEFYRRRLPLFRKAHQAVKDLDFALKQPAAEVPELLDMRVRYVLKAHKLPAAVESAAKMKERAGDKAQQLYDTACAYALCAGAKEPGANATGLLKQCADEAMALLKQAIVKGFKNAAHMKQDRDLDALRDRADFQKLLAELAAAKKD